MNTPTPAYFYGLTIEKKDQGYAVTGGFGGRVLCGNLPSFEDAVDARRREAETMIAKYGISESVLADVRASDAINNRVHAAQSEIEAVEGPYAVRSAVLPPTDTIGFCLDMPGGVLIESTAPKWEAGSRAVAMEGLRDMWLRHRADERAKAEVEGVPALAAE